MVNTNDVPGESFGMARTAERGAQVLALASIMVMCRCAKWAWGVHREEERGWVTSTHARLRGEGASLIFVGKGRE